jgi:hypothetical protein
MKIIAAVLAISTFGNVAYAETACPTAPHVYFYAEGGEQFDPQNGDLKGYEWEVTDFTFTIDEGLGENHEVWELVIEPISKLSGDDEIITWPNMGGEDGDFYSAEALEELGATSVLPRY